MTVGNRWVSMSSSACMRLKGFKISESSRGVILIKLTIVGTGIVIPIGTVVGSFGALVSSAMVSLDLKNISKTKGGLSD